MYIYLIIFSCEEAISIMKQSAKNLFKFGSLMYHNQKDPRLNPISPRKRFQQLFEPIQAHFLSDFIF